MRTSEIKVVDDELREFDFSRSLPSPFRALARRGMRFDIVTDGADLPVYHVRAEPRGRSWWIEIGEIEGSGRAVPWSTIELVARQVIARSRGIDPSAFDLVIDVAPATDTTTPISVSE